MLNLLVRFAIKNKLIIALFVLLLGGAGAYNALKLPIDAVPDITNNQVQVITVSPAFSATDIERFITVPIEQANSNIAGLKEIRSFCRFGLSVVTIVFEDDVDIYWARQQINERLQKIQTQIPPGMGIPEMGPIATGLSEIYQYVLRCDDKHKNQYDITTLRTIQDWIVRKELLRVPGIAEVNSFGGKLKQYHIAIDVNKLHQYNLSVADVAKAIEDNNQNTGGAYIEKNNIAMFIRTDGLLKTNEDIENIIVKTFNNGLPILIKHIAKVQQGYATRYGAICYNDEGEVAGGIVMMLKGASSNIVIKSIKDKIIAIQKILPDGVIIEPFLDRSKMVNSAISTVVNNLAEGALIVIFILVLFLSNWRASLLIASMIPLSMCFAIIMMNVFHISGNLMSLGALDFGLIIDGAVIIVESVLHHLHKNKFLNTKTQTQLDDIVAESTTSMMTSAAFGQLIILLVYVPILALKGVEGKMFIPMALTVIFALAGSFILSLTYVPMMSSILFKKENKKNTITFSDKLFSKITNVYQHFLYQALVYKKAVIAIVVSVFIFCVYLLFSLGGEFIPVLEEGDFAVDTKVLAGSNLNTTIEYTQKACHILKTTFPEIEKIVTKIGSPEVPTDPMAMDASDMMIMLKPKKQWTSAQTFNELSAKMHDQLKQLSGVTFSFQYPVQMRFNELLTGARQDVICKIFGNDLNLLDDYASQIVPIINSIQGTQEVYKEFIEGIPQIVIQYDRQKLMQYNVSIKDANYVVNTCFAGAYIGNVFEQEKRFDIVLKLDADKRESIEDVKNLLIKTGYGTFIPLRQLAQVSLQSNPNQIQRDNAKRRIVVGFNVRNRDVESVIAELQKKINAQIHFQPEYSINYGGTFENLNQAKMRLSYVLPITLFLIFFILLLSFNSIKDSLIIYATIPLSVIGGILFLFIRDMPFSISAAIGFIALFGIAVLNGIVLLSEFKKQQLNYTNILDLIIYCATTRLKPILMTASVAALGFLPMAFSTGPGGEVQKPLATVVIGGVTIATLLTLFVLPILYYTFNSKKKIII